MDEGYDLNKGGWGGGGGGSGLISTLIKYQNIEGEFFFLTIEVRGVFFVCRLEVVDPQYVRQHHK